MRPFGVFCDFSRFFRAFEAKNRLQSSINAVPKPDFFIFKAKFLVYFLRFFALQRKRKSVEGERLEPEMVSFSLFLALQEKPKKLGTGGFEPETGELQNEIANIILY